MKKSNETFIEKMDETIKATGMTDGALSRRIFNNQYTVGNIRNDAHNMTMRTYDNALAAMDRLIAAAKSKSK